jgi:hypothetical protein
VQAASRQRFADNIRQRKNRSENRRMFDRRIRSGSEEGQAERMIGLSQWADQPITIHAGEFISAARVGERISLG